MFLVLLLRNEYYLVIPVHSYEWKEPAGSMCIQLMDNSIKKYIERMRYSVVNKAISDFKKISNNSEKIAELMLYYAEVGVDFTNTYGDIDERFYDIIERAYMNTLEYIYKNDLQDKFKNKIDEIRLNTDGIDWAFYDNMDEIYYDYYSDFKDEED